MAWSIVLSAAAGILAWYAGGHITLLASVVPVLLWASSPNRGHAAAVMATYLCAAGHPVPQAVANFSDWPQLVALPLYTVYAALYGLLWGALWHRGRSGQCLGLGAALLLLSVPPMGTLYFGSPSMAAGVLFPGTGLAGLGAFWALLSALVWIIRVEERPHGADSMRALVLVIALSACSAWFNQQAGALQAMARSSNLHITVLHTHLGEYPASTMERYQRQFELLGLLRSRIQEIGEARTENELHLLLLPEGVAGLREARMNWLWEELAAEAAMTNVVVAIGNSHVLDQVEGRPISLLNQVQLQGAHSGQLRALVNVPVGSWKPWEDSGHYPARWLEQIDQIHIQGHTIGALMCWEELIMWTWIRHAWAGTTTMLVASNTWFDHGRIDFAQRRATWAMSRLFGYHVARAANTAVATGSVDQAMRTHYH